MKRLLPALVVLAPAAALAFVMSAGSVLRHVAARREELELASLVVRGTFTFQGPEASEVASAVKITAGPEITVPGAVTYKMPGRCKIELEARSGAAPTASNVHGSFKAGGATLAPLRRFAMRVCPLLAQPSTEDLVAFVKARGVDTSHVTLGRFNGTVSYVVGGRARDTGVSTFWVGKERYEPLRLAFRDGPTLADVKLLDYSSPLAGEWHPRVVEIRHGESVTRFVADKIEANAKVSDSFF